MKQPILYIKDKDDNYVQMEMFSDETITLTSKIQDVKDISKVFTDFSQPFTLPASKENNKVFQHWYNYNIDDGFNSRVKKDALLEIDYSPYKRGKVQLQSVKLKDNKPFSYSIVFYGNTVELGTLMGDDELSLLGDLDQYGHDYSNTNVKTGLQSGLFSGQIIYPLISHTKRFYYDSAQSSPEYNGNLYYNNLSNSIGLSFEDLKPAIKCMKIIEAIEAKYNISFTRDFFNETSGSPFSNLFLWLSRNKGKIGGDINQEEILSRICKDWGYVSGLLGFIVTDDSWVVSSRPDKRYEAKIEVSTSGANTSIPYRIKAVDYVSGNVLGQALLAASSFRDLTINILSSSQQVNYQIKWIIESEDTLSFTPALELKQYSVNPLTGITTGLDGTTIYNINGTGDTINTTENIIITENVPQIKTIDFLTGLFKMFNLTAYYIDDIGDADFGKIYVDTLDNFYSDAVNNPSSGSYDITSMVDVSNIVVDAPTIYSGLDFNYEEPSTLLAINHEEQFNDIFGNEKVREAGIDKGEIYSVETPFEHMKFERIIDENKSNSPKVSGTTTSATANKLIDSTKNFTTTVAIGDVVNNTTDNTTAIILSIDSNTTISINADIMESGENYNIGEISPYGDITTPAPYITDILWGYSADGNFESKTDITPATGDYEPVLTKPLIFYPVQETINTGKGIKWISDGSPIEITQYYRPSNTNESGSVSTAPAFTINFDNEIDEWNLVDYGGTTNSLFKKFYEDYITDLFDSKKRIYKIKAYLTKEVLINMRLNDELIIQDRRFTINSITTNLKTEVSEIELLNKL